MRITVRPLEAFSVCGPKVEEIIKRAGRDNLGEYKDDSYCGQHEVLEGGKVVATTKEYCDCSLDFTNRRIADLTRGIPGTLGYRYGNVYFEERSPEGREPAHFLDADVPVFDETKALDLLSKLSIDTDQNCAFSGIHYRQGYGVKHVHFECARKQEGLLPRVGEVLGEMLKI